MPFAARFCAVRGALKDLASLDGISRTNQRIAQAQPQFALSVVVDPGLKRQRLQGALILAYSFFIGQQRSCAFGRSNGVRDSFIHIATRSAFEEMMSQL